IRSRAPRLRLSGRTGQNHVGTSQVVARRMPFGRHGASSDVRELLGRVEPEQRCARDEPAHLGDRAPVGSTSADAALGTATTASVMPASSGTSRLG
ncbi:hypothetical protein K7G98_35590, partial [Saccharothrix sp. MB29]|nr:hypothetical protein [Saccharothrix sp. MB29]